MIRLVSKCFFQFRNECGYPFVFLDCLEGDAIYTGAAFVGACKVIGVTEDVGPIDLVIQGVDPMDPMGPVIYKFITLGMLSTQWDRLLINCS